MALHELGHCVAAWCTGGIVAKVHFPLLGFSQTILAVNPHPLAVAWAGPLGGSIVAGLLLLFARFTRSSVAFALRFFTGFCLIANGLYLGLGVFERVGDCADLLNHGAKAWQLVAFGLLSTAAGLFAWHQIGGNPEQDRQSGCANVQNPSARGTTHQHDHDAGHHHDQNENPP